MTPLAAGSVAPVVERFVDHEALVAGVAHQLEHLAKTAISRRGRFTIALAGGSTPRPIYERLARASLAWDEMHFFWSDERCVPPADVASNYRMAREALLDPVGVPAPNIWRMHGEDAPELAAVAYEQAIRDCFKITSGAPPPKFDLVLLGLGLDGHTASLFPGAPSMAESTRWVLPSQAPDAPAEVVPPDNRAAPASARLTMTPHLINAAHHVMFIVSGRAKAARVRDVLLATAGSQRLPAAWIAPQQGELRWMVDQEAAMALENTQQPETDQ